jgi:uncharacterized LabA/DUF88 family protein
MNHIAKITVEFLKIARKWDDMSYDEQKSYLQRHPKTKRRLTARPSSPSNPQTALRNLNEIDNGGANIDLSDAKTVQKWMDKTKQNFSAPEIQRHFPNFDSYNAEQIAAAFLGRPPKSTSTALRNLNEIDNGAAEIDLSNAKDIQDWIDKTKANFDRSEIKKHFPNFDSYNAEEIAAAFRGPTAPAQKPTTVQKPVVQAPQKPSQTVPQKPQIVPSQQKPEIKKPTRTEWPEQDIVQSFKSLKSKFSSAYMVDDEPYVNKDENGKIRSVELGFRGLGSWISHEEDDDNADWAPESQEKYSKIFKNWLETKSWFDENTMTLDVYSGEKSWAYFAVVRKDSV